MEISNYSGVVPSIGEMCEKGKGNRKLLIHSTNQGILQKWSIILSRLLLTVILALMIHGTAIYGQFINGSSGEINGVGYDVVSNRILTIADNGFTIAEESDQGETHSHIFGSPVHAAIINFNRLGSTGSTNGANGQSFDVAIDGKTIDFQQWQEEGLIELSLSGSTLISPLDGRIWAVGPENENGGSISVKVPFTKLEVSSSYQAVNAEQRDCHYSIEIPRGFTGSWSPSLPDITDFAFSLPIENTELENPGNEATVGYQIEVIKAIEVTHLGIVDADLDQRLGNLGGAEIGIWAEGNPVPLASVIIPQNAEIEHGAFYGEIAPLRLSPGKYRIASLVNIDEEPVPVQLASSKSINQSKIPEVSIESGVFAEGIFSYPNNLSHDRIYLNVNFKVKREVSFQPDEWETDNRAGVDVKLHVSRVPFGDVSAKTSEDNFEEIQFSATDFSTELSGEKAIELKFSWDQSPELPHVEIDTEHDDRQFGIMLISFNAPVRNPIIHIQDLGDSNYPSGASFEILTPDAQVHLLSGSSSGFLVSGNKIFRQNQELDPVSGSVKLEGVFTTIELEWTGIGVEGIGSDTVRIGLELKSTLSGNSLRKKALESEMRPLSEVPIPLPRYLNRYVADVEVAKQLGKALFWDQQVGSNGIACASCHFHAGADSRTRNMFSPLPGNGTFDELISGDLSGPNFQVEDGDGIFPLHQKKNPNSNNLGNNIKFDTDDYFTSSGAFHGNFVALKKALLGGESTKIEKIDYSERDPDGFSFSQRGGFVNVRRVEPRQTPTVINSVFNFRNFWDGRANFFFNGENPFGPRDPEAGIYNHDGSKVNVMLENASLASQAVGPPLSDLEMSARNKSFAQLGRKMLAVRPLALQKVHGSDSLLGNLADTSRGLTTSYADMIKQAFKSEWIGDTPIYIDGEHFSQTEANFPFIWGISLMLYQAELVSDQTPIDKYLKGDDEALNADAKKGLELFIGPGKCVNCHGGANFTNASTRYVRNEFINRMIMGDNNAAIYDEGFYNIGVRPTFEDLGVGANDPFGNPLSFSRQAIQAVNIDKVPFERSENFEVKPGLPPQLGERVAVDGAFKTPGLRNVELTGPYFHNGGQATLEQVVEFYARGGDFSDINRHDLDADIQRLNDIVGDHAKINQLVEFMIAMTDERVRHKKGIFDHPELFLFNGHPSPGKQRTGRSKNEPILAKDAILVLPAVGQDGSADPIKPFLKGIIPGNVADHELEIVNGYSGLEAIGVLVGLDFSLPPMISDISLQESTIGTSVYLEINAWDPDDDNLTFYASNLPPGLEINQTSGLISGKPQQSGTFEISVSVSDGKGGIAYEYFSWRVYPMPNYGNGYFNGFEMGQIEWGSIGDSHLIHDTDEAYDREYFLRIPADSGKKVIRYLDVPESQWSIGREYSLEFFARRSDDSKGLGLAGFTFYDDDYNQLESSSKEIHGSHWSKYTVDSIIAPEVATQLEIWTLSELNEGYIDFDFFHMLDQNGDQVDGTIYRHGFEQGQMEWGMDGDIELIVDGTNAAEGFGYLSIQANEDKTSVGYLVIPSSSVVAGSEYVLEFKARFSRVASGAAVAGLTFFDSNYNAIDGASITQTVASEEWTQYQTGTISVPSNAMHAEIWALKGKGEGKALFDDFHIRTSESLNDDEEVNLVVDGDLSDWDNIQPLARDSADTKEIIDIRSIYGIFHDDTIYMAFTNESTLSELNWGFSWYLDTDRDSDTGYAHTYLGSDYLIEGNTLYKFAGSTQNSFQWNEVAVLPYAIDNNSVEMTLDPGLIGDVSILDIVFTGSNAAFEGDAFDNVPNAGTITLSRDSNFEPGLVIDGDFSDWPHESYKLLDGEDVAGVNTIDIITVRIHADDESFYVGYENESFLDELSWGYSLFLDTDDNNATGFLIGTIGADYLLQDDALYSYNGHDGSWSWDKSAQAIVAVSENLVEYEIPLTELGYPQTLPFLLLGDNAAFGSSDGIDSIGGSFQVSAPKFSQTDLLTSTPSAANSVASQLNLAISSRYPQHSNIWLRNHGHNALKADIWDLDSDGDGYSNLAEYAAGSHPNDHTIKPHQAIKLYGDNNVSLRFQNDSRAQVTHTLEVSSDLINWDAVDLKATVLKGDGGDEITWELNADSQNLFFRVQVELKSIDQPEL